MLQYLSYIIFLAIACYITCYVGWLCYKNGYLYVLELFDHQENIALAINKLLLIAYYLVNIGFVFYAIRCWAEIETWRDLVEEIAEKTSLVIMTLCVLHFKNMALIYMLRRYKDSRFITFFTT